jgi:hypothetical protein
MPTRTVCGVLRIVVLRYKGSGNRRPTDLKSSSCQPGVCSHPLPIQFCTYPSADHSLLVMATGYRNYKDDYFRSWEAFDRMFTAQPVSSRVPERTRVRCDDAVRPRPMAPEPFSTPHHSRASSSSTGPTTPAEHDSIDRVWSEVRRNKERAMAASPSKIKSLETRSSSELPSFQRLDPPTPPPKSPLKKQKSK